MPEHAAMDNRRQIHLVGETVTVFFIGQDIGRQWQTTPGQHCHHAVLPECIDETIERHGREMTDDRAEFQTEPPMHGYQGRLRHVRMHVAIA
jgi:hypothetical protein